MSGPFRGFDVDAVLAHLFVRELQTEARPVRDGEVGPAVLPLPEKLLAQHRIGRALLEDDEVGQCRAGLQVRGQADGPVGVVRRHGDEMVFGHRAGLSELGDAADARDVRLVQADRFALDVVARLEPGFQPFTCGDRDAGRALDFEHRVDILRRHRLLEEQRHVGLDGLRDPHGRSHVEFRVRLDADLEVGRALADPAYHLRDFVNRLQRRLTRQVVVGADQVDFVRIVEERVPLAGQRALRDELLRALRVRIRGPRNVTPLVAGVDLQLVVHLAAEQLVHRHIELLPDNVPERDVDRGNRRLHGAAVHGVASSIDGVPDLLDVPRALADDERPDHFDLGRDRCDLREIGALPPADVPILGPHAAHQIEAAARPSLLVAAELHDVRLDGGDLELTLVGRSGLVQDGVRVAAGPRADGARSLPNLNRRGPQNARAHACEKVPASVFVPLR